MTKVVHKEAGKFEQVYVLDAVLYYPRLDKPQTKYQSDEKEYSVTAFIDTEARQKLESHTDDGGIFVNKSFAEVGVDKNKKRKIKFPTSDQVGEDERNYDDVKGLHGVSLTAPEFKKNGEKTVINLIDSEGNPITKPVGTGSKANIRVWGWRNDGGELNITLDTVQVTELVEGNSGGAGGFDDILGVDLSKAQPVMKGEPEPDFGGNTDDFDERIPF